MAQMDPRMTALLTYLDAQARQRDASWPAILERTVQDLAAAHPHFDWTGIYLLEGETLVLGPYVGAPTEHQRIGLGEGICGAAAAERETLVVDDVGADPRYLACFVTTRSEIVVPILDGERVLGEIDVDSDQPAAFGPADRALLEQLAERLARLAPPPRAGGPLDGIGEAILARLDAKNGCREAVLAQSRHAVQHAARAIRAAHRADWDEAEAILAGGGEIMQAMQAAARGHADLQSAGYMLDAQKELAEAHLTLALLRDRPLPGPEQLGVADAAWLNGLGEAAGELRRAALDAIRLGRIADAEALLERMQEIHTYLSTVDYPAAITLNLKRTNDMVRGVTERTRGDLTVAVGQAELKAALARVEAGL